MTPSSYKIVKLINGEDIICTITPLKCDKHIRVEFPLKMQVAPRIQRDRVVESLHLSHWVHPATETTIFDIPSTSVIMVAEVSPGLSKYRPNKVHENIMIFSKKPGGTYNPIMEKGKGYHRHNPDGYGSGKNTHGYGFGNVGKNTGHTNKGTRYPKSILHASRNFSAQQTKHPTQKPTPLLAWLIMTYSNKNDTVLDFTMGSGGCGVATKMTGRKFIGIELDKDYFDISKKRIDCVIENTITSKEHLFTTQLTKDMKTLPESELLRKELDTFEKLVRVGPFD